MNQEGKPALTDREWSLVSKLNQVCMIAARFRTREQVLEEIGTSLMVKPAEAERWLRKAEEYMASGAIESVDAARDMYHVRLTEIYARAMEHSVKDVIEITTKPTRLVIDESGETRVINATHHKVKPNMLDTGALQVALKAAREAAHIMGVRPNDRRRGVAIGTVNMQINSPQASTTMEMANNQLASMIGAEIIDEAEGTEILPEPTETLDPNAAEAGHTQGETDDRV